MKNYQITQWCAAFIRQQVQEGDFCIDATMGNGNDTLLLSQLCGESGKVLAFDIQEQALTATQKRLNAGHVPENYRLLLESHANMAEYATPDSVSCIVFNFGYLPGVDVSKPSVQLIMLTLRFCSLAHVSYKSATDLVKRLNAHISMISNSLLYAASSIA